MSYLSELTWRLYDSSVSRFTLPGWWWIIDQHGEGIHAGLYSLLVGLQMVREQADAGEAGAC